MQITREIENEYKRLRATGERAEHAIRGARTLAEFTRLESLGLVRLRVEWENDSYDMSYVDTWTDKSEAWRERVKKETWARIEREGVTFVVTEYKVGSAWEYGGSCGGFIGDDWKDSGYVPQLQQDAIDGLREALTRLSEGAGVRAAKAEQRRTVKFLREVFP